MDALIRYYLHIDPDSLTDDKYCEVWQGLHYALDFENKRWEAKNPLIS